MIVKTYYPDLATCPVCREERAVILKDGPAVFYRCSKCNEAVKLDGKGGLKPWLNIYRTKTNRLRKGK